MPLDLEHLGNLLVIYSIDFLGAFVVALIGWWAASFADRATRRALMRLAYMDSDCGGLPVELRLLRRVCCSAWIPIVEAFLSSVVYYAVLVVALAINSPNDRSSGDQPRSCLARHWFSAARHTLECHCRSDIAYLSAISARQQH
jgi:hypothetical protein